MIRVSELKLPVTGNQKALEKKLAKALRVPVEEIKAYLRSMYQDWDETKLIYRKG